MDTGQPRGRKPSDKQLTNLLVLDRYPSVHLPQNEADALVRRGWATVKHEGWTPIYSITPDGRRVLETT